MIAARDFRVVTILAFVALAAWTLWRGAMVAGYEVAMLRSASPAGWMHEPGVAPMALDRMMRAAADPADASPTAARSELLTAYLTRVPLSSQHWLELAVMRNASGAPADKVAAALAMSSLTGPNEASVLLRRSAFALSIWEKLDSETQGRAANDLAVVAPPLDPGGIKLALAIKTDKVRNEVRAALAAHGVPAEVVRYIGL